MPRTIYTERDLEDLARRGVKEIALNDDVYLTDVARERAEKLGIVLKSGSVPPGNAVSTTAPGSVGSTTPAAQPMPPTGVAPQDQEAIIAKVKADVLARLGPSVDAAIIERIVRRVVSQLK